MKRRTPMPPRTSKLTRSGPIRRKARPASETRRIYGEKARIAFVKALPCIVTRGSHDGVIEVAHHGTGGMGRKADSDQTFPCCTAHHRLLHNWGVQTFQRVFRVNLERAAAATEQAWQSYTCATHDHLFWSRLRPDRCPAAPSASTEEPSEPRDDAWIWEPPFYAKSVKEWWNHVTRREIPEWVRGTFTPGHIVATIRELETLIRAERAAASGDVSADTKLLDSVAGAMWPNGTPSELTWRQLIEYNAKPTLPDGGTAVTDGLLAEIADYGWCYDGRVTFTLNMVSVGAAKRMKARFDDAFASRRSSPAPTEHKPSNAWHTPPEE